VKIAIIGPPGSGKTTLAAGLFYKLKKMNKKVELVPELIKYKVYRGEDFGRPGFDIANTLQQQDFELAFNDADFEYLIFEAPLCNGYFYSSFYGKDTESLVLKQIAKENIKNYDVILSHKILPAVDYSEFGRKESKEVSIQFGQWIEKKFKELGFKGKVIQTDLNTNIRSLIEQLKGEILK
jgi:GTPase SAR1 family protein